MKSLLLVASLIGTCLVPVTFGAPAPQERREASKAEYHFRQEDTAKLRANYRDIDKVDRNNRPHYVAGDHLPGDWKSRIHPIPAMVVRELPAIPAGFVAGYIDGYAVVYDPNTGVILDVIDVY